MKKLIEEHSGKPSSSISSKTAFIILGENAGPEKMKKAAQLGIRTVSEAEFYEIIGEKGSFLTQKELTLF